MGHPLAFYGPTLGMVQHDGLVAFRNTRSRTLLFANDTFITIAALAVDSSKENVIEYDVRLDDQTADHSIWGTAANDNFTRWRFATTDIRALRGGVGTNFTTLTIVPGRFYVRVREVFTPAGTLDYQLAPGESQSSATLGNTGTDTGLTIGRGGGAIDNWVGRISNFKVFDGIGQLQNHWPIDDDVVDGGIIKDISGGQDGILTLGAGSWV